MKKDDPERHENQIAWDGMRVGQDQQAARVFVLIAREAPIAAVFRRGPGRRTALLKWDLATDELTLGQWIDARIYERRCDLSPDGKHLCYFAAKYTAPLYSWTAISTLPYFTASVLWVKGDGWGGGGHFDATRKSIILNHRPGEEFEIDTGHLPRPWKNVTKFGSHPGWGEDDPINSTRLQRDGWKVEQGISKINYRSSGAYIFIGEGQNVVAKSNPNGVCLRLVERNFGEVNGRHYLTEARLSNSDETVALSLGQVDWADWHGDDLLFARNGCLYRILDPKLAGGKDIVDLNPVLIRDLTPMKYQRLRAPYHGARPIGGR